MNEMREVLDMLLTALGAHDWTIVEAAAKNLDARIRMHDNKPVVANAEQKIAGYTMELHEVTQLLGKALGYPANKSGCGVEVGPETAVSLSISAFMLIDNLKAKLATNVTE